MSNSPAIFSFGRYQIRTAVISNAPWFAAKDVCSALNIDWGGKTLASIPNEWQSMGKLPTLRRGEQQIKLISEPAVYKLAFRSNKPEADAFTNWVAAEVLPAIRKTGKYEVVPKTEQLTLPPAPPTTTQRMAADGVSRLRKIAFDYSTTSDNLFGLFIKDDVVQSLHLATVLSMQALASHYAGMAART